MRERQTKMETMSVRVQSKPVNVNLTTQTLTNNANT